MARRLGKEGGEKLVSRPKTRERQVNSCHDGRLARGGELRARLAFGQSLARTTGAETSLGTS